MKDPYNMYYTPDGKYAIVVAEREKRLDFYDAQTMKRGLRSASAYPAVVSIIWTSPRMAGT